MAELCNTKFNMSTPQKQKAPEGATDRNGRGFACGRVAFARLGCPGAARPKSGGAGTGRPASPQTMRESPLRLSARAAPYHATNLTHDVNVPHGRPAVPIVPPHYAPPKRNFKQAAVVAMAATVWARRAIFSRVIFASSIGNPRNGGRRLFVRLRTRSREHAGFA